VTRILQLTNTKNVLTIIESPIRDRSRPAQSIMYDMSTMITLVHTSALRTTA